MDEYIAFLRGINVGGNSLVKMEELKKAFEALGFTHVKTILASGNVLFTTAQENKGLTKKIEDALKATFGFNIFVILCTIEDVRSLVKANPFKSIKVTPTTRLLVTFLWENGKGNTNIHNDKDIQILNISKRHICSFIDTSSKKGTVEVMKLLEKEFGKKITTRTWNTLGKILEASQK